MKITKDVVVSGVYQRQHRASECVCFVKRTIQRTKRKKNKKKVKKKTLTQQNHNIKCCFIFETLFVYPKKKETRL